MNTADRAKLRRKLLSQGYKTAGLSDEELLALGSQTPSEPTTREVKAQVAPTPTKPAMDLSAALSLIQDRLEHSTLDETRVVELIREHSNTKTSIEHVVHVHKPDTTTVKIEGAHPMLPKLLDVHAIGENAYLVGPASSGKTTMAKQCADALGLAFHATGAVVDKFELLGFVDAGGKYHRTALREAVEHGGVFLFDEVDSSYPAPLNAFNALLENGHITFPDGATFQVDRTKTFFVCAANTLGTGANRTYVGRFELDRAFLDRFVQLEVDYDEAIENSMAEHAWLSAGGNPDNTIWQVWAEHVREFRSKLAEKNIKVLVTPRATRRGAGLLARGWELDDVQQSELYKHLSTDQRQQVLA